MVNTIICWVHLPLRAVAAAGSGSEDGRLHGAKRLHVHRLTFPGRLLGDA